MVKVSILYPNRPEGTPVEYGSPILSSERLQEVLAFENALFHNKVGGPEYPTAQAILDTETPPTMLEAFEVTTSSAKIYPEYFLTDKGKGLLQKAKRDIPETVFESETAMARFLSGVDWTKTADDDNKTPIAVFGELAGDSLKYIRKKLAQQLAERDFKSVDGIEEPLAITVSYDPEKLLTKLVMLRFVKDYYSAVLHDITINQLGSEGEGTIAKLYIRKTNWLLASLIPEGMDFIEQAKLSGDSRLLEIADKLLGYIPVKKRESFGSAVQRYDRFRNGVLLNSEGNYSVINPALLDMIERDRSDEPSETPVFTKEQTALLEGQTVNAEELQSWFKLLLSQYGLLSAIEKADILRAGRAEDDKWQVIMTKKVTSLSVDGRRALVKVPSSWSGHVPRAVALACHEFGHVVQHENKRNYLDLAIGQEIGADRASVNFEAGGLWYEETALSKLFGDNRPAKRNYLAAIKTRLEGGSFLETWKAYYDSAVQDDADDRIDTAERAVSYTRRIFRNGGLFTGPGMVSDSQPLHYIEQELLVRALSGEEKKLLLLGGMNIENINLLSRAGIIDVKDILAKIWVPEPWEILKALVAEKLAAQG